MKTFCLAILLFVMCACGKEGTIADFRAACLARHLTCDIDQLSQGRWMASARSVDEFGRYHWHFGHGFSQSGAIGDILGRLDDAPAPIQNPFLQTIEVTK